MPDTRQRSHIVLDRLRAFLHRIVKRLKRYGRCAVLIALLFERGDVFVLRERQEVVLLIQLLNRLCGVFGKLDDLLCNLIDAIPGYKREVNRSLCGKPQLISTEFAGCRKLGQRGCGSAVLAA